MDIQTVMNMLVLGIKLKYLLLSFGICLLAFALAFVVKAILMGLLKRKTPKTGEVFLEMLLHLFPFAVLYATFILVQSTFHFPYSLHVVFAKASLIFWALIITWVLQKIAVQLMEVYFKVLSGGREKSFLPFLKTVVRVVFWLIGIIFILSNLGYTITSLAAGLGIGGLAVALAVKPTLESIFASLSLFSEKPFSVGDSIRFDAFTGKVTRMGLRSTKIQTASGSILLVPNTKLMGTVIENKPTHELFERRVSIAIANSAEKIEKALLLVKDILQANEHIFDAKSWIDTYTQGGIEIAFTFSIKETFTAIERKKMLSDILLNIQKSFQEHEIAFAEGNT